MPDDGDDFDVAFDRVLATALGTGCVPDGDTDLLQIGLESLEFVSLMIALEDEFAGEWSEELLRGYADLTRVQRLRSLAREMLWRPPAD